MLAWCPPHSLINRVDDNRAQGAAGGERSGVTVAPSSPSRHAPDCEVAVDTLGDVTVCPLLA